MVEVAQFQEAFTTFLEPALAKVKELAGFLVDQPLIMLSLGFLLSAVVVKEALYQNGSGAFSSKAAGVIALIVAIFATTVVASFLPTIGQAVAWIVIWGLPIAVLAGLLSRLRGRGRQSE